MLVPSSLRSPSGEIIGRSFLWCSSCSVSFDCRSSSVPSVLQYSSLSRIVLEQLLVLPIAVRLQELTEVSPAFGRNHWSWSQTNEHWLHGKLRISQWSVVTSLASQFKRVSSNEPFRANQFERVSLSESVRVSRYSDVGAGSWILQRETRKMKANKNKSNKLNKLKSKNCFVSSTEWRIYLSSFSAALWLPKCCRAAAGTHFGAAGRSSDSSAFGTS